MSRDPLTAGFTAVELLITLFVAAVFLIAGYQLFSVIIQQSGDARNEAKVSGIAYTYLRQYETRATYPCSSLTEANQAVTIEGVVDARLTATIACASSYSTRLSKVTVTIEYNTPRKTTSFSSFKNVGEQ